MLTLVAGYINIVGYLSIYQVYTAQMSGNTAAMAKHIYAMEWAGLARRAWPILTFVAGLIFGSVLFEAQRRKVLHERLPAPLLLESLLVFIFLAATAGSSSAIPRQPAPKYYLMVGILAVAMGVQNAVVRRVGGLTVYTTFVTGALVQFGEAASQYIFWVRDRFHAARAFHGLRRILRITSRQQCAQQMALTAALWISYLAGATDGAAALDRMKTSCVAIPRYCWSPSRSNDAARPVRRWLSE